MRHFSFLILALLVLPLVGCGSSNKSKIEGTKWTAASTTVDGKPRDAGFLEIEFDTDGSFVFKELDPTPRPGSKGPTRTEYRGTYTLGSGDKVELEFDDEYREQKVHEDRIIIEKSKGNLTLTLIEPDGKQLLFYEYKEKPVRVTTPVPVPRPVSTTSSSPATKATSDK